MSVGLEKVVGFRNPDKPVSWTQRDLLVYALGVGAKKDDLPLIYENDRSWAPLPTYAAVLELKGDTQEINNFVDNANLEKIDGLPDLSPGQVVHSGQSVEVLKDLPAASGPGWKLKGTISSVTENKSGIIVTTEEKLVDSHGTVYARLFVSAFYLGAKSTGQRFSKQTSSPPEGKPVPPGRKPDFVFKDQTTPEQAALYRLNADYNPLHIDPKDGAARGFGGTILHGLSTYGFAARALIKTYANNNPRALRYINARFVAPVVPGDTLETHFWEVGDGPNGTSEIAFITKDLQSGRVVLGSGSAYIYKAPVGSKL